MYGAAVYDHLYNTDAWRSGDIVKRSKELCIFYYYVIDLPFIPCLWIKKCIVWNSVGSCWIPQDHGQT